jgi:hypothetical protein
MVEVPGSRPGRRSNFLVPGWRNWQPRRPQETVPEMMASGFESLAWYQAGVAELADALVLGTSELVSCRFDPCLRYQIRSA